MVEAKKISEPLFFVFTLRDGSRARYSELTGFPDPSNLEGKVDPKVLAECAMKIDPSIISYEFVPVEKLPPPRPSSKATFGTGSGPEDWDRDDEDGWDEEDWDEDGLSGDLT